MKVYWTQMLFLIVIKLKIFFRTGFMFDWQFSKWLTQDKKEFYNPNNGQGPGKPQNPPQQSNSNHKPPKNEDDFLNDWFNLKNEWFNDMDNEFNFFD